MPVPADVDPGEAWLVLRPEVIVVEPSDDGAGGMRGAVQDLSFRGTGHTYRIVVAGLAAPLKAEVAATGGHHPLGSEVSVRWDPAACRVLPRSGDD